MTLTKIESRFWLPFHDISYCLYDLYLFAYQLVKKDIRVDVLMLIEISIN